MPRRPGPASFRGYHVPEPLPGMGRNRRSARTTRGSQVPIELHGRIESQRAVVADVLAPKKRHVAPENPSPCGTRGQTPWLEDELHRHAWREPVIGFDEGAAGTDVDDERVPARSVPPEHHVHPIRHRHTWPRPAIDRHGARHTHSRKSKRSTRIRAVVPSTRTAYCVAPFPLMNTVPAVLEPFGLKLSSEEAPIWMGSA